MKLSVVTTLYRSAQHVEEFHRRISLEARKLTDDYELLFVDDGSPDDSLAVALRLVDEDAHVRVLELSRNFGHHAAMMTGLEHARGDLVFLIDVDLEEPPELLSQFHAVLEEGRGAVDVVYGLQEKREGGLLKRFGGAVAWRLFRFLLPIRVPQNHCTVRLMTHDYVRALVAHRERQTAIGGLWVITGFRQVAYRFRKRSNPTSSYSRTRRVHMLLESITSFSERPLLAVLALGVAIVIAAAGFATYLIVRRVQGQVSPGWTSVMVSLWFLGGVIVFSLGILGLYISRIFIETKNRPYTIIRRSYEHPRSADVEAERHSVTV